MLHQKRIFQFLEFFLEFFSNLFWICNFKINTKKRLTKDIELFVAWMEARPEEIYARNNLIEKITAEIRKVCGKTCEVKIFGSFASGLHLPFSDIDLVVLNSERENAINRVGKSFRNVPFVTNLRVIKKARVPIIKFEDLASGVPVDICFGVMNGLDNTPIIQKYLKTFKKVRFSAFFIFLGKKKFNF